MSPVFLPSGDGIPDEQGWIRRKSEALSDKQRVTDGLAGDRRTEGRPHDITLIHAWRPCNLANLVCPTLFSRFHLPLHSNILDRLRDSCFWPPAARCFTEPLGDKLHRRVDTDRQTSTFYRLGWVRSPLPLFPLAPFPRPITFFITAVSSDLSLSRPLDSSTIHLNGRTCRRNSLTHKALLPPAPFSASLRHKAGMPSLGH